ncbi:SAM domain-containing protein SAMSN-1a isoform X2 [Pygocentrus nattereri]|uniref:SAM domain-containing protein SAMSN-1a isoform X2 n=1 Tax=Pygocentrus nattereri TaxID=42514 RepID=UPI00081424AE|nr:SAM domain-containing protein SAMSN-1a isoform X2 [Pygocentrus nattereri]
MNLFCFSLEGSMDSLYEAVQEFGETKVYTIPSRSSSPADLLDQNTQWRSSEGRSMSMDISQINSTNSKKKKRRALPKSVSVNDALDNTVHPNAAWPASKKQDDSVRMKNNQNQVPEQIRSVKQAEIHTKDNRSHPINSTQTEKELPVQIVHYDGWNPQQDWPDSRQCDMVASSHSEVADVRGTIKKGQKSGKQGSQKRTAGTRTQAKTKANSKSPVPAAGAGDAGPTLHFQNSTCPVRTRGGETAPSSHQRWSNPADPVQVWPPAYHTCRRPLTEYHAHSHDLGMHSMPGKDMINSQTLNRVSSPQRMVHSITSVDLCGTNAGGSLSRNQISSSRSTSFGKFDGFRHHHSPTRLEENGTTVAEGESGTENGDKHSGLGKKMKAISLTMRMRIGKKHGKSCSEDMGDDTDREAEGEADGSSAAAKTSHRTSNSLESLHSGQSSSSGVTSSSDVSSNRDSLRLEEEVPFTSQFCGRARVHTDFVPSPYDTDSLKLKVGDIINIISKPPMGIWTGMLKNKVGNFKFIYVDVLAEKDEEAPKIRPQRLSKRPRPKTLLELLERLHLEEYASTLLLNGYQTVDDLKHLQEKHLIELNVSDPEHRRKLLAASEVIYDMARDDLVEMKVEEEDEEGNDCPRDSGCFIPAECADTGREDIENHSPAV